MKRFLWFSLISLICSAARGQGVGGNGVPGAGSGSGSASIPATSSVLKGAGSAGSATAATPGTDYMAGVTATAAGQVPVATGAGGTYSAQTLTYNNVGASPGVTPLTFGGYGDAVGIYGGCSITAASTTLNCGGTSFSSATDVGKQMWVPGAGAAGISLHTTIASVTNANTVVLAAAASTSSSNVVAVYGHDDVTALQSCFNYSAVHQIACVLNSPTGYLVGSGGLQIAFSPTYANGAMNVIGNSGQKGTVLFCEYNGDCLSLQPGPVQGASMSNIEMAEDPSQPNSRGIHLNAATGSYSSGGLYNSFFNNVQVDNPNLECLWSDGGGGPGYTYNLPNQYITFNNFTCNGPIQSHPANLIKISGQHAQIVFINGAANGQYPVSLYPNWLIAVEEKTAGLGDSPADVKFFGYTYEVGTQGMFVGEGSSNIHYDNGYIENIATPYYAYLSNGLTFNGNHIANSGNTTAVLQYAGQVTGSARDNYVYGSLNLPAAFAVCTNNNNTVDLAQNTSTVTTTTSCGTSQIGPTTSTLTVAGGNTEFVNGSATTITTINAPGISPGKSLTLYAASSPGITLGSGGNINFGGLTSPLTIPAGQNVTLTLFDLGPTWLITSTTAVTTSPPSQNSTFFDDFYTGANMAPDPIGSPMNSSCSPSNTYTDNNHPGNMLLTAGTAGTGTGIVCGLVSENNSVTSANTAQGWTWETAVYVPVLPATTVGAYQAGMAHIPNANPWTTGIGFYLSSANSVVNDWYCRYNSTSIDSGVAATVAWTRLTMVNDGTNVHWYIGGTQVCGTGVAIGSMPSTTQYPAVWSATALSGTSVTMAYDYINWQRAVTR